MNDPFPDDQSLNPAHLFPDDFRPLGSKSHWRLGERSCLATVCKFFTDRAGLTDFAFRESWFFYQHQAEIANPGLVRSVLTKRTAQSLARLEQAVTATLAYVGTWKDINRLSLAEKVKMLREKAGEPGSYAEDEDDWRPLVDQFDYNLVDIAAILAPEMAIPGCATLAELAELRFSLVTSYAHATEFMAERDHDFVAPTLGPESTWAEFCAELGMATLAV